jgi:catechol 2,3-dioxygenase-like lactoylglutathione lyase family enzyme
MRQAPPTIGFVASVPQFAVADLVRSTEYYRDVLGFQIAGYWDGERVGPIAVSSAMFAIVWRDQVQVFFNRAVQSDMRTVSAEAAPSAYFRVTGVDALSAELRARGADILDGPEDRVYGQRELVVRDGNGLILVFGEDTSQPAISIMGIDHVQLAMPLGGEDTAREFYFGLLGIPEAPKPAALAQRGGVWFQQRQVKIHLGVEGDFRPARKGHPALLVRDLAALVQRLGDAGVRVVDDGALPGYNRVYVSDPFGNRLELMEEAK